MSENKPRLPLFEEESQTQCSSASRCSKRAFLPFLITSLVFSLGLFATGKDYLPKCFRTFHDSSSKISAPSSRLKEFQQCSIRNFQNTGLGFLDTAVPIALDDFEERRNRLARALVADGADAFVVEPGYTFKYFANVSQPEWEVWEVCLGPLILAFRFSLYPQPEERPFLMVVQPFHHSSGRVTAKTSFLCPSFEAERARLLGMPFAEPLDIVPWEEHWNPYETLKRSNVFSGLKSVPRLMVDEEMRDFIQRGLGDNGFQIIGLQGEVERVRQIKSDKEVGILQAVSTGTVEAVRQMRKCQCRVFTSSYDSLTFCVCRPVSWID